MASPHLDDLNPAQREAATFGVPEGGPAAPAPPLLVVAGAGTGKTGTLAHRVAHLVAERRRPPPRPPAHLHPPRGRGDGPPRRPDLRPRARHRRPARPGVGRHLPRRRRPAAAPLRSRDRARPGLHRARPGRRGRPARPGPGRAGPRPHRPPLPAEGDLPRRLLGRGQHRPPARRGAGRRASRGAPSGTTTLKRLFAAYVAAKQRQGVLDYDDLLLWWERTLRVPEIAADAGGRFDHVLVDEYQDTNALQAAILRAPQAGRARRHGGRGRRAGDLLLPRRHACATSWTSRACSRRPRPCSGWSGTTARRSRSWTRPTR